MKVFAFCKFLKISISIFAIKQHSVDNFVRRIVMDVQRSSALKVWNVWMCQHLVQEQFVELVLWDTLVMDLTNATVCN